MDKEFSKLWWGPPKNFLDVEENRKVSWMELFFDLVYVIALGTITHTLEVDFTTLHFFQFLFFFVIVFWGWLNGSQYMDIHGTTGLRTRLMTLYQMMIVAALAVVLTSESDDQVFNITIVLMLMQLYITYMWHSVGFYDKNHRRYSKPYTICYLISFALMGAVLWVPENYQMWLGIPIIFFNFLPPFFSSRLLRKDNTEFTLSESMVERLGLFTIIIFGEVVLSVINGMRHLEHPDHTHWIGFVLGVAIVFSLWWLFFTMVSDRKISPGFSNNSIMEMLYMPPLICLLLLAVSMSHIFGDLAHHTTIETWSVPLFLYALGGFMMGLAALLRFLVYDEPYTHQKPVFQRILLSFGLVFFLLNWVPIEFHLNMLFVLVLLIILALIGSLNWIWYQKYKQTREDN